jgi:predicted choloylglycine hydrolase
MATYPMTLYGIRESQPGPRWRALFDATWPAYRAWYLRDGAAARPSLRSAAAALARHMPELLPTWARLAEQTGYDDLAAGLLAGWDLPPFAPAACSQVTTRRPTPALLRNYDYAPSLFEQVSLSTEYLQPVIGTSDCLWGLLDGMNGRGLAVSLAFGGDRAHGEGFAIPMVLRYLLETCESVEQAEQVLARLPVAMVYNVTMIDRSGWTRTAHLRPGRDAEFRSQPAATNHRWDSPIAPEHAQRFASVQRLDQLSQAAAAESPADTVAERLLSPPLHVRDYAGGFGTLYTADYRLEEGTLTYRWPGLSWTRTFSSPDDTVDVVLHGG